MNENETEVVVDDDNYDVDLSEYENLTEDDGDGNQTEPTEPEETTQEQGSAQGEDEQANEGTAADEQPGTEEPMFDLKYNKETKQYTRQQVTELAQKGLNYDHVSVAAPTLITATPPASFASLSWSFSRSNSLVVVSIAARICETRFLISVGSPAPSTIVVLSLFIFI